MHFRSCRLGSSRNTQNLMTKVSKSCLALALRNTIYQFNLTTDRLCWFFHQKDGFSIKNQSYKQSLGAFGDMPEGTRNVRERGVSVATLSRNITGCCATSL